MKDVHFSTRSLGSGPGGSYRVCSKWMSGSWILLTQPHSSMHRLLSANPCRTQGPWCLLMQGESRRPARRDVGWLTGRQERTVVIRILRAAFAADCGVNHWAVTSEEWTHNSMQIPRVKPRVANRSKENCSANSRARGRTEPGTTVAVKFSHFANSGSGYLGQGL